MNTEPKNTGKTRSGLAGKIIKGLAWCVGGMIALLVAIITLAVWILTPARLTPIITDAANTSLDAEVTLERAELTFWSTFPTLYIQLDSLTVKSNAFDRLMASERTSLPKYADTLARIGRFRGGVNVLALLGGKISLHDVALSGSALNAVVYDSTTVNFNIVPPSDKTEETTSGRLPDIYINRFDITDCLPIRFYSRPDSVDVQLTLQRSEVITSDNPAYRLRLDSDLAALLPPDIAVDSLTIALDGRAEWHNDTPARITLSDFNVAVSPVKAVINTSVTLGDTITVDECRVNLDKVPVMATVALLPEAWRPQLQGLETDMAADISLTLARPYSISSGALPYIDARLTIPPCRATYDGYTLSEASLTALAEVNGDRPELSTVNLENLMLKGDGMAVKADGKVSRPLSDPLVDGHITAGIDLTRLPRKLLDLFPGTAKGRIDLNTAMKFRLSDLTPKQFHRMRLDGDLDLVGINLTSADLGIDLYTHSACFKLGTNNGFVTDRDRIDSLLTASLHIDTLAMTVNGMKMSLCDLKGGIGCSNKASSTDTTAINPIGASLKIARMHYNGGDSMRVHAGEVYAYASLRRFEQQARLPLMNIGGGAGFLFYADSMNRVLLRKSDINLTAHMRPVKPVNPKIKHVYDSIAALHPGASTDSIVKIMRSSMPGHHRMEMAGYDVVDFGIDSHTRRLLNKWNVSGSITAERGRMFTPYFPLRNRLSHVDVKFSTDSIIFNNIEYRAGGSDFLINGGVRDMRRALSSRRPLQLSLSVKSDTLNVNELVQASYNGAAFAEQVKDGSVTIAEINSETELDHLADSVSAQGVTAALLVPVNIGADIDMKADNIIYSDMYMTDFNGELHIKDGAINLRDLSARSGIGNARLTALYTAPTKRDIRFGFGLELSDIKIKEFIGMMPAVDSLMPLLQSFEGRVNADVAATARIDSMMNIELPSLNAAVKLEGNDLVLLDAETFRTLSKWLMFKDKKKNVIPHMAVEMLVNDSRVELFPFVFDFDRYRLAVMGSNDLALNYKYHVSVLKSPIPFKFGINLSGNADKMKVRLGKAKYKPDRSGETIAIVDTTRINLLKEIDNIFRRGARNARLGALKPAKRPDKVDFDELNDTISHEDSVMFIDRGLLPAPPRPVPDVQPDDNDKKKKKKK